MHHLRQQWSDLMGSIDDPNQSFTDENVCKYFLTGLCPHDLFENEAGFLTLNIRNNYHNMKNKFYLGPCKKRHIETLRDQYFEARKQKRYGFEELAVQLCRALVEEADKKVQTAQMRVDCASLPGVGDKSVHPEVLRLDQAIAQKFKEMEDLGKLGRIDQSMAVSLELTSLQTRRAKLLFRNAEGQLTQRLRPCDVCGALLSANDTDRRLDEHFSGRVHLGFQKLRDALKKNLEYIAQAPMPDQDLSRILINMQEQEQVFKQLQAQEGEAFDIGSVFAAAQKTQQDLFGLHQQQKQQQQQQQQQKKDSEKEEQQRLQEQLRQQLLKQKQQQPIPDFLLKQRQQQQQQTERGTDRRSPSITPPAAAAAAAAAGAAAGAEAGAAAGAATAPAGAAGAAAEAPAGAEAGAAGAAGAAAGAAEAAAGAAEAAAGTHTDAAAAQYPKRQKPMHPAATAAATNFLLQPLQLLQQMLQTSGTDRQTQRKPL
ncbi:hypothetical protein, conserved [Eimeria brunetti]|uniref:Uncharacterized protein n=1 Tax=Eimeria brunetti TaxID=51314 RepID=U6LMS1_9EIME|nr:hypothetical protein, conserved [Eimeria brunetti]